MVSSNAALADLQPLSINGTRTDTWPPVDRRSDVRPLLMEVS